MSVLCLYLCLYSPQVLTSVVTKLFLKQNVISITYLNDTLKYIYDITNKVKTHGIEFILV